MKMPCKVIAIGALLAGSAVTSPVFAACSEADKAALEKLDRAWGDAALAGDSAALDAIYAADYVDLQPGNLSDRKAAIDGAMKAAAKVKASGKPEPMPTHDFYLVNCTANSALITHRNTITVGEGDAVETIQTRSVHQLEKSGGKWKVVSNATHALNDAMRVRYMDLEWNIAELTGNKAWFERNLADGYVGVISRDGKLESKEDFLATFGTDKVTVAETSEMDVQTGGDHALVTGVYLTRGTDDKGKAFERRTRYIDTFAKKDGRWQIYSSQGTEIKD